MWINPKQAAERIGVSVAQLAILRRTGRGPRFHKVGRLVRYRTVDVDAWVMSDGTVREADATSGVQS